MTMSPVPVESPLPQSEPSHLVSCPSRFSNLRGVRWRIDLGILPSSPSASIEEIRRVSADSRRSYASMRRHLLIDPHLSKDGTRSPDLIVDNPLSQNPESTWGRFFRNAELEKLVDKDLSRLYPEHGNYFQTPACQAMLRRILLLWCLRHPEYGYRQGMHELLAPLLYVLQVDLQHLSQVKELYEDCFSDEFDEMSFNEGDMASNYRFSKSSSRNSRTDSDSFDAERNPKVTSLDDLSPEIQELFMLSDAYGAEGELGVILSERFMEHDAYCMFDGLMGGAHGVVAMADFFSSSPSVGSSTGLPPVIEASSALYHLLSKVDSSLHTHLIELGVEPQYFALRWLRVLFGREFTLDDLLLIWDELFSSSNASIVEDELDCSFIILCCPRGALISAMAVSMLINLRSSLLATENATSCLQRLLNFPRNVNVRNLIEKAKSWQVLALETNILSSFSQSSSAKPEVSRMHSLPTDVTAPKTPSRSVPDSYWEEKWRVLHKEVPDQRTGSDSIPSGKIKKFLGDRFGLSRTKSDSSPAKKETRSSVRRRLLDDLADVNGKLETGVVHDLFNADGSLPSEGDREQPMRPEEEPIDQNSTGRSSDCTGIETCLSGEHSSVFSVTNSPHSTGNNHDNDDSEKSSVTSNSFVADNDEVANQVDEIQDVESNSPTDTNLTINNNGGPPSKNGEVKRGVGLKEKKLLSGKFQWLLRLAKGSGEGGTMEEGLSNAENATKEIPESSSSVSYSCGDGDNCRVGAGDMKVMGTLKNLGLTMLDNIQVIESVFQQERGQAGNTMGAKGQATAMTALKELRKISNLLSEM